jgi:glutamate/tyrosine decarboxylase-like PLP-dependent enzyme
MSLDPDFAEMRRLGHLAVDRAVEHLATLGEKRVARRVSSHEMHELVHEPLPRRGHGVEDSLARFFDRILPSATLVNHPRFFAYVPGPGSFVGALGEWVAAATNLFVGTWLGGASAAQLEIEVLDWLRQALGLPGRWHGVLTSGGSMANLAALAAARARAGAPAEGVVYASDEAHYSVTKAARVLGFADARVRVLPADDAQRLAPATLAAALRADRAAGRVPVAVCATVGTTTTGAIDEVAEIADLCRREGVWLHVDGAYGGAAALLPEQDAARAGLERADSITLDPHKWLYCPFEAGSLLVRDEAALRAAFGAEGRYLQDIPRDEVNFFERGPELSRGNRALKLWLLLRAVGIDAIAAAIREDLRLCRLARDLIAEDPRLSIVTEPQLSVFTFEVRDGGEAAGRELIERILADGFAMLSSSRARGCFVLRFCVVNHRTTESDVRRTVARIRALL